MNKFLKKICISKKNYYINIPIKLEAGKLSFSAFFILQNEVVPHGGKMSPKFEESISFILDGKMVVKNVMPYRIITYNKINGMPVTVQNIPRLDDSGNAGDETVLSEVMEFDFHGRLKSLKRLEIGRAHV